LRALDRQPPCRLWDAERRQAASLKKRFFENPSSEEKIVRLKILSGRCGPSMVGEQRVTNRDLKKKSSIS
jgi:hypothetical protein